VAPERSRIIFAEGEEERVLRAAQILVDEKLARPVLIGRRGVIEKRIKKYGLRLKRDEHFINVDPEGDPRYREYWEDYRRLMSRHGVTAQYAKLELRRRTTLIASMLLRKGEGDGMICGTISGTARHLRYIERVLGRQPGASVFATMSALVLPGRQLFIVDTHVNLDPTAEQLAEITLLAADGVRRFGIEPKVALISHSNFGSSDAPSAVKMRQVLDLVRARAPELAIDGEMHGDSALDETIRKAALPETTLHGEANLLVLPNLDAANISYNLLKTAAGQNVAIGPILLGCAAPVNVLTPSVTVRRIVNMAALTVVHANVGRGTEEPFVLPSP
jgi:malate dehydrogenase (oxaloacetate-decarboxylating)(NADP+)